MTAGPAMLLKTPRIADGRAGLRHVFVRDLVVDASIGVHGHEHMKKQRIRVNLDLAVKETDRALNDNLYNVVCYEKVVAGVKDILERGHVNLVETLAEDIAEMCLADGRVRSARVRVEKLDVLPDAASAGVEIERFNG